MRKQVLQRLKKSGKTHAHKIQAAIAMEQRARVMGKTGRRCISCIYKQDEEKDQRDEKE